MQSESIKLPSGDSLKLREMTAADGESMLQFAQALPQKDLQFLRIDITQQSVVDDWLANLERGLTRSIVALSHSEIVGYASVHQNPTLWTRHLGEVRVNVNGAFRSKGLGRVLTARAFDMAREMELRKLTARMTADQTSAQAAFARLGFVPEAVLADYVMDKAGATHDMVIMSFDVGGHSDIASEPLKL